MGYLTNEGCAQGAKNGTPRSCRKRIEKCHASFGQPSCRYGSWWTLFAWGKTVTNLEGHLLVLFAQEGNLEKRGMAFAGRR